MSYAQQHLAELVEIIESIDSGIIDLMADQLARIRSEGGRLFFLGVGGSAANCSHAVGDFRKLTGIECYAPTDNVAELTARTNDEGWASVFVAWLKTSRLSAKDAIMVLSVGGGSLEHNISPNLVAALDYAHLTGAKIFGVVGRDGGHVAVTASSRLIIPTVNPATVTPHCEAVQGIVMHLLVSHPALKIALTKWESESQ